MPDLARFRALHANADDLATLARFPPTPKMVSSDEPYPVSPATNQMLAPPVAATDKLLRTITRESGLPCSGGLATTRLTAKVASDQAKPRGLVWVAPGQEA